MTRKIELTRRAPWHKMAPNNKIWICAQVGNVNKWLNEFKIAAIPRGDDYIENPFYYG
jgi:hypothetical protein